MWHWRIPDTGVGDGDLPMHVNSHNAQFQVINCNTWGKRANQTHKNTVFPAEFELLTSFDLD